LSSANQAENSGDASGPDTSQTILFIVAAFAAVAVGAALTARKFAIGASSSNESVSVDSAPSQAPVADGRLMNVD
jgi:archaellum component FlaG (FlaF/FlaG flagellin family)